MQEFSLYKNKTDWDALRKAVYAAAGNAQAISGTYQAIALAYTQLGDYHGGYHATNGQTYGSRKGPRCSGATPATVALPSDIRLVEVPGCPYPSNDPQAQQYAQQMQDAIRTADADGLCPAGSWIFEGTPAGRAIR